MCVAESFSSREIFWPQLLDKKIISGTRKVSFSKSASLCFETFLLHYKIMSQLKLIELKPLSKKIFPNIYLIFLIKFLSQLDIFRASPSSW